MNLHFKRLKELSLKYLKYLHNKQGPTLYTFMEKKSVKLSSQRYAVFQKSHECKVCGLKSSYLAVESDALLNTERYHINMYGIDKNGDEVLFTKDHIIPKSKGGKSILNNYQTLCVRCNGIKSDNETLTNEEIKNIMIDKFKN